MGVAKLTIPSGICVPGTYSSLHSRRSLAWDHIHADINDPCGVIVDFCGVIADPCGVVTIPQAIGGRAVADRCATRKTLLNTVKYHETHVKHCDTS